MNEIVFPASILQPPFFDANADDAVNYGAIGAVIGHEISHGFDDQGAQYDGDGNLRDWWTPADHKNFAAKTKMLVAQYNCTAPPASWSWPRSSCGRPGSTSRADCRRRRTGRP